MANLIHPTPQFGFRTDSVNHSPALGFGFGLSPAAAIPGWQPPHTLQSPSHLSSLSSLNPASSPSHPRVTHKRRHEDEDRDESMDRSPTPERRPVRRMIQKRARVTESGSNESGEEHNNKPDKEKKLSGGESGDGVDVGMLLASLPPQSLLPILTSLLSTHPTLKPIVLSLIPRPTLDTALNALNQSIKKLREAYPYSTSFASPFSQNYASTSFGFGSSAFGSGNVTPTPSSSGFGRISTPNTQSGMRDSYVQSRLRPHIADYVSTALSYLPYFSHSSDSNSSSPGKEKVVTHPTETFCYLSSITDHLISQPPLSQSMLAPLLLPRLLQEWVAWVDRIDQYVNEEAGLFGREVAQNWIKTLEGYADTKIQGANEEMERGFKDVRDKWISRVGWLVGRREVHRMEEEEEL